MLIKPLACQSPTEAERLSATDAAGLQSQIDIPPLVFTAIVVSLVGLRGVANAARLALRTLLWFGVTAAIAVSVGIGLGLLTNPGRGVTVLTRAAANQRATGCRCRAGARSGASTGRSPAASSSGEA